MFERGSDATTRRLSEASFALESRKPASRARFWLLLLFAGVLVAVFYRSFKEEPVENRLRNELSALKQGNAQLLAELGQVKMALEHERATRESLAREMASQAEALKQANRNLSFYRSQTGRSAPVAQ